jgi:hypothetical protein
LIDQYDHLNDHHPPAVSLSGPGKWMGGLTDQTRHSANVERLQRLLIQLGSPSAVFMKFLAIQDHDS